jgi:hypothetical protein
MTQIAGALGTSTMNAALSAAVAAFGLLLFGYGWNFSQRHRAKMKRTPADVDWGISRVLARAPTLLVRALVLLLGLAIFGLGVWGVVYEVG